VSSVMVVKARDGLPLACAAVGSKRLAPVPIDR